MSIDACVYIIMLLLMHGLLVSWFFYTSLKIVFLDFQINNNFHMHMHMHTWKLIVLCVGDEEKMTDNDNEIDNNIYQ